MSSLSAPNAWSDHVFKAVADLREQFSGEQAGINTAHREDFDRLVSASSALQVLLSKEPDGSASGEPLRQPDHAEAGDDAGGSGLTAEAIGEDADVEEWASGWPPRQLHAESRSNSQAESVVTRR